MQSHSLALSTKTHSEYIYSIISAVFIASTVMMNVLGMSRFVDFSFHLFGIEIPMILAIGVLPYPLTFLCTDLVSELYGKKRANLLVLSGFIANCWMFFIFWVSGVIHGPHYLAQFDMLPAINDPEFAFYKIRLLAMSCVISSMVAYTVAQYLDVYLYHFWKKFTQGKHLWLRNNGSTMVSQLVDSIIVVFLTYLISGGYVTSNQQSVFGQLCVVTLSIYTFKFIAALIDTLPFYLLVGLLRRYVLFENQTCALP